MTVYVEIQSSKVLSPATYKQQQFLFDLADSVENAPRSGHQFQKYCCRYAVSEAIDELKDAKSRGEETEVVFV